MSCMTTRTTSMSRTRVDAAGKPSTATSLTASASSLSETAIALKHCSVSTELAHNGHGPLLWCGRGTSIPTT